MRRPPTNLPLGTHDITRSEHEAALRCEEGGRDYDPPQEDAHSRGAAVPPPVPQPVRTGWYVIDGETRHGPYVDRASAEYEQVHLCGVKGVRFEEAPLPPEPPQDAGEAGRLAEQRRAAREAAEGRARAQAEDEARQEREEHEAGLLNGFRKLFSNFVQKLKPPEERYREMASISAEVAKRLEWIMGPARAAAAAAEPRQRLARVRELLTQGDAAAQAANEQLAALRARMEEARGKLVSGLPADVEEFAAARRNVVEATAKADDADAVLAAIRGTWQDSRAEAATDLRKHLHAAFRKGNAEYFASYEAAVKQMADAVADLMILAHIYQEVAKATLPEAAERELTRLMSAAAAD